MGKKSKRRNCKPKMRKGIDDDNAASDAAAGVEEMMLSPTQPNVPSAAATAKPHSHLNTAMKTLEDMDRSNKLHRLKQHDIAFFFTNDELERYFEMNDKSVENTLLALKKTTELSIMGCVEIQEEKEHVHTCLDVMNVEALNDNN